MAVVLYEKDLLFIGRISAVTERKERKLRIIRSPERLVEAFADAEVAILNLEILPRSLWDAVHDAMDVHKVRVVGHCSHTQTSLLDEAREMGMDAMPRSQFVSRLADIV